MYFKRIFSAFALVVICAAGAFAAEGGALSQVAAKRETAGQSAANLGAGGPGTDLKAIASPKKGPTTFTGFPAGTLPGSSGAAPASGTAATPAPLEGRVVLRGDPLAPVIGPEMVGTKLDRISAIVDHAGYRLIRMRYAPRALDSAYTFRLWQGKRRVSTLYFDRSMKLTFVQ